VARWRKRIALWHIAGVGEEEGGGGGGRGGCVLYFFRPPPKQTKTEKLLGLALSVAGAARKGSFTLKGTSSSSSTASTPSGETDSPIADEATGVLNQVPRVIRGNDIHEFTEEFDCGEPVGGAALSIVHTNTSSKKGVSTVKVCMSSKSDKIIWVKAFQKGLPGTSCTNGRYRVLQTGTHTDPATRTRKEAGMAHSETSDEKGGG
jgi:hypothetical protein